MKIQEGRAPQKKNQESIGKVEVPKGTIGTRNTSPQKGKHTPVNRGNKARLPSNKEKGRMLGGREWGIHRSGKKKIKRGEKKKTMDTGGLPKKGMGGKGKRP